MPTLTRMKFNASLTKPSERSAQNDQTLAFQQLPHGRRSVKSFGLQFMRSMIA